MGSGSAGSASRPNLLCMGEDDGFLYECEAQSLGSEQKILEGTGGVVPFLGVRAEILFE